MVFVSPSAVVSCLSPPTFVTSLFTGSMLVSTDLMLVLIEPFVVCVLGSGGLGLNKSVSDFIACCLVCKRFAPSPRGRSLLGVFSSPTPLDVVSLDFVGPRKWGADEFYYIVAIDHCSRFVVAKSCSSISSSFAISFLKERWIPCLVFPRWFCVIVVLHSYQWSFASLSLPQ